MNNIVLICDDAYALPTAVCIRSIITCAGGNSTFTVHVCTFGLTEKNTLLFENMGTSNVAVRVHSVPKSLIEEKVAGVSQKTHVTKTALIKLELPNYFKELDRLLYIDSDIIVKGMLDELFETSLDGYYLAASFEFWIHQNNVKYGLSKNKREDFYFNSGVMLLNLKKMREDDISDKLWDYKLNCTKTKLMDQECLNAVCHDAVKPISIKWNFNPTFLQEDQIAGINAVYGETYDSCEQLLQDVRIIHYVGKQDKPWVYDTACLREFWMKNYDATEGLPELNLKSAEIKKQNILKSSLAKIKQFGFNGYAYFVFTSLKKKVKR